MVIIMKRLTPLNIELRERLIFSEDWQTNEAVKRCGDFEDLMDKYSIPDIDYLEQCIKRSDKYGELSEQLFDLELLFKALKEGIYTKPFEISHVNHCKMGAIDYDKKKFRTQCEGSGTYYFKDYLITWCIDKEDINKLKGKEVYKKRR